MLYFALQSPWTITPQPAVHFQAYDEIEILLLHNVQVGDIIDKTCFLSQVCLARLGDFPALESFGSALRLAPPSFALTGVCDVQNESGSFCFLLSTSADFRRNRCDDRRFWTWGAQREIDISNTFETFRSSWSFSSELR